MKLSKGRGCTWVCIVGACLQTGPGNTRERSRRAPQGGGGVVWVGVRGGGGVVWVGVRGGVGVVWVGVRGGGGVVWVGVRRRGLIKGESEGGNMAGGTGACGCSSKTPAALPPPFLPPTNTLPPHIPTALEARLHETPPRYVKQEIPPGKTYMHWKGAQPLPSNCLPDAKCKLQWHF